MKRKKAYQAVAVIFLLLFLSLTYIVTSHVDWLNGFDQTLTKFVRIPFPDWNHGQRLITSLGNPLVVILFFLISSYWLWSKKQRNEFKWLAINFIGVAGILNPLIKFLVRRDRPSIPHLVAETTYSFPSGHAATSMIFYGTFIFLLPILISNRKLALLLQILLTGLILSIGVSRIYLGVHYPSDIVAGYSLSLTWLCFTYPYYREGIYPFKTKKQHSKNDSSNE